jgi:Mg-chelatase subunit ChlD/uncharacterized protein involved in exopolysaccharide biosynthesis
MNPDNPQSPREELEARLTALLLGELPDEEAAALRGAIEQDAELARHYKRLRQTIEMVRATATRPAEQTAAQPAPLRLSDERRQKLLAHFKTVAPEEFVQQQPRESSWLVPLGAAAAILLLAAIVIPNFAGSRESSQANSVINNLRILEGAKEQWALENKKSATDMVSLGDLMPYLKGNEVPQTVLGENYIVGTVSDPITADLDAAQARKSFSDLATKQPAHGTPGQRARLSVDAGLTFVDRNPISGAPWSRSASLNPGTDGATRQSEGRLLYASAGLEKESVEVIARQANRPDVAAPSIPRASKGGQSIYLPTDGTPAHAADAQLETRIAGGGFGGGAGGGGAMTGATTASANAEPGAAAIDNFAALAGQTKALPMAQNRAPVPAVELPQSETVTVLPKVNIEAKFVEAIAKDAHNPIAASSPTTLAGRETDAAISGQVVVEAAPSKPATLATVSPNDPDAVNARERVDSFEKKGDATPGAKADRVATLSDAPAPGTPLPTDAATADTPLYYNRLMMERYALIPQNPLPPVGGETLTVAPTEYGIAPTIPLETTGKDLSTWAAVQSGVVVTNGMVPGLGLQAPEEKTGALGPFQEGKLLYEMGRVDEAETRLKQALEKVPSNQAAHYYLNLVEDAQVIRENNKGLTVEAAPLPAPVKLAANESVRKNSTSLALPASGPEDKGRKVSDLESRQIDVLTDGKSTLEGLNPELGRRNEEVAKAQAAVDELRKKLKISDVGMGDFASTLEPETVRRLEAERVDTAKTHAGLEMLLKEVKNKPKDSAKEMLLKTVKDDTLASAAKQLEESERDLARLSTPLSTQGAEAAALQAKVRELTEKVDARVNGIVSGLELKEQAANTQVESLDASIKNARDEDAAKTQAYRPYFLAKRELENRQKIRDALALRILQETVDASLPKTGIVEILDLAEAKPAQSPTLWERIGGAVTGDVGRTARISVEKDTSDIMPLMGLPNSSQYDPYFIQTEFEKIRSRKVLYRVIEKLNLNETWARKHASGEKLKTEETFQLLSKKIDVRPVKNSSLIEIKVTSNKPDEAARIANTIAEVYRDSRMELRNQKAVAGKKILEEKLVEQDKELAGAREELQRVERESNSQQADEDRPAVSRKPDPNASIPQPEVETRDNAFSTFSLNVSDVSFKLASASLEKATMPEPATVRSEEFINAFDYHDPEPPPGVPIAFVWERARYPFAHNRDLLRFSVKTAAAGRQPGRPLNLVLLLDNSGSMERADRVRIIHEALRVLATQLQPQDKISVITFARTARLWMDGVPGNQAAEVSDKVGGLTPQGGTNLEEAMNLAYQTALRHYLAGGENRVVLLTDGAANLGNVDPESLKQMVEAHRRQGVALDCFGVGWEGFNDDLLEVLSRNGDGRYGFMNSPEDAATEFAGQLAGALRVAASDVKVQVEFNPRRAIAYRQIGYAKHQLTKEQFRDNTVDAAEIGAAESGNALYVVEVNPRGEGPLAIVRVRFKVPGTSDYREHEWAVPFTGNAVSLEQASPAMRIAATASAFSEWLVSSPYAAEVTPDRLLGYLGGVPEIFGADARPKKLEWMIRQAKAIAGK